MAGPGDVPFATESSGPSGECWSVNPSYLSFGGDSDAATVFPQVFRIMITGFSLLCKGNAAVVIKTGQKKDLDYN